MTGIKENKKDIDVIYFWPDTEALSINLWNILDKDRWEKLEITLLIHWIIKKYKEKIEIFILD